jgi:hypothetical protein
VDFDALWVLAAIWFVFNLLSGARRKPQRPAPPKQPSRPREQSVLVRVDPTQQEGGRLERMLRELQQSLEEAAQERQPESASFPSAEEVEERTSLEEVPEIRSLEEEVQRTPRTLVDRDDEAASFETLRIAAAAAPSIRGIDFCWTRRSRCFGNGWSTESEMIRIERSGV